MRAAVITISDSVSAGRSEDLSGPGVAAACAARGWEVCEKMTLADEQTRIEEALSRLADSGEADVILTTGGTGVGPRDVTPEATMAVCERLIVGLAEQMRMAGARRNPRAMLSRAVAGVRGMTLIVNLPGSPRGAVESLEAVAELLPHACEVIGGARHDG
jgi:molybdopterin adenylyltransferase